MPKRIISGILSLAIFVTAVSGVSSVIADNESSNSTVKDKAALQEYVNTFGTKFFEETIYDYSSYDGENFFNAYEFAENVLSDENSDQNDYSAAYMILKSAEKKLVIFSKDDLKALVAKCKSVYDTNNILNSENGDKIYSDYSFGLFSDAYECAANEESTDTQIIADAYVNLDNAYKNLVKLEVVPKVQMMILQGRLLNALKLENKYESSTTGTITISDVNYSEIAIQNLEGTKQIEWGDFFEDNVYSTNDLNTFSSLANISNQYEYFYNAMDEITSSTKTTNSEIVKFVQSAQTALDVFNSFKSGTVTPKKYSLDELYAMLQESYDYDTYKDFLYFSDSYGMIANIRTNMTEFYNEATTMNNYTVDTVINDTTSSQLCTEMEVAIRMMKNDLKKFPVDYGTMYDLIGEAAKTADDYAADNDFIQKIEELSYKLFTCPYVEDMDACKVWDSEIKLIRNNRIFISILPYYNMTRIEECYGAYNKLLADKNEIENPDVTIKDTLNGEKAVSWSNAIYILKNRQVSELIISSANANALSLSNPLIEAIKNQENTDVTFNFTGELEIGGVMSVTFNVNNIYKGSSAKMFFPKKSNCDFNPLNQTDIILSILAVDLNAASGEKVLDKIKFKTYLDVPVNPIPLPQNGCYTNAKSANTYSGKYANLFLVENGQQTAVDSAIIDDDMPYLTVRQSGKYVVVISQTNYT